MTRTAPTRPTVQMWLPHTPVQVLEIGSLHLRLRSVQERRRILDAEAEFYNGLRWPLQRIILPEPLDLGLYQSDLRRQAEMEQSPQRAAVLLQKASHVEGLAQDRHLVRWRTVLVVPASAETREERVRYALQSLKRLGVTVRELAPEEAQVVASRFVPPGSDLDFRPTGHFQVGGRFCRVLAVREFPRRVRLEQFLDLYRVDRRVTIVQHIEPVAADFPRRLSNSLGEIRARLESPLDEHRRAREEVRLKDAEALMAALASDNANVLDLSMYCLLLAERLPELDALTTQISSRFESKGMRVRPLHAWQNEDGLRACYPAAVNPLRDLVRRNLPAGALPAVFPYAQSDLNHGRGLFFGVNKDTGSAVIADPWTLGNSHIAFLGQSGQGKTFTMSLLLMQQWAMGVPIRSLDIDGDRNKRVLWNALGAQRVRIAPGAGAYINPMEIRRWERTEEAGGEGADPLQAIIQRQLAMFRTMGPYLSPGDLVAAEKLLQAVYEAYRVHLGSDYPQWGPGDWPTWAGLYEYAQRYPETRRLAQVLYSWVQGSLAGVFERHTTVKLSSQHVVMDISEMARNLQARGPVLLAVLGYLWDEVNQDWRQRKVLDLDEFGLMADNTEILQFLWMIAKCARRRSCSLMLAAQDPGDFLLGLNEFTRKYALGILNNCASKVLGLLDKKALDQVQEAVRLTDAEVDLVSRLPRDEKLVVCGDERAHVQVVASPEELRLLVPEGGES